MSTPTTRGNEAAIRVLDFIQRFTDDDEHSDEMADELIAALAFVRRATIAEIREPTLIRAEEIAGYAFIEGVSYVEAAEAIRLAIFDTLERAAQEDTDAG